MRQGLYFPAGQPIFMVVRNPFDRSAKRLVSSYFNDHRRSNLLRHQNVQVAPYPLFYRLKRPGPLKNPCAFFHYLVLKPLFNDFKFSRRRTLLNGDLELRSDVFDEMKRRKENSSFLLVFIVFRRSSVSKDLHEGVCQRPYV